MTALNYSGYEQLTLHLSAVQKNNPNVQLDVNAIAKGFGVDEVSAFFGKNGLNNYMVEIGGEVYCKGVNEKGEIWRIGIESPNLNDTDFMNIVSLKNRAMASSGDYRNYYSSPSGNVTHIVDPRTGQPVSEIAATTVIAENCMDADALATALMVLGVEKGLILIEQLDKVEGMVVKRNENMELEKSIVQDLSLLILFNELILIAFFCITSTGRTGHFNSINCNFPALSATGSSQRLIVENDSNRHSKQRNCDNDYS